MMCTRRNGEENNFPKENFFYFISCQFNSTTLYRLLAHPVFEMGIEIFEVGEVGRLSRIFQDIFVAIAS